MPRNNIDQHSAAFAGLRELSSKVIFSSVIDVIKIPVLGTWRLLEMEQWNKEFLDLVEPAFISFYERGKGEMRFGAVCLDLEWKATANGKVGFTFTGFDEGDEVCGKGRASLAKSRLVGQIKFHEGDQSGFIAKPWRKSRV